MKVKLLAVIAAVLMSAPTFAGQVNGYFKKDGTYVAPHQRSNPDQYKYNNRNSETNGGTQKDEYSTDDNDSQRLNDQ